MNAVLVFLGIILLGVILFVVLDPAARCLESGGTWTIPLEKKPYCIEGNWR